MTLDAEGRVLRSVGQLDAGATITTRLADGQLTSRVVSLAADDEQEG